MHETDPAKGGAPLDELKEMCPADIRHAIFNDNKPRSRTGQVPSNDMPHSVRHVVPWHRVVAFQLESLRQIAEEMLLHTPKYKHYLTKVQSRALYSPTPLAFYTTGTQLPPDDCSSLALPRVKHSRCICHSELGTGSW